MNDIGRQVGIAGILLTVSLSLNHSATTPSTRAWNRRLQEAADAQASTSQLEPLIIRHSFRTAVAPEVHAGAGLARAAASRSVGPDSEDNLLSDHLTSPGLLSGSMDEQPASPEAIGILDEFLAMDEESFELDPADIEIPELREDTGHQGTVFTFRRTTARAGDTVEKVAARERADAAILGVVNGISPHSKIAKGRALIVPRGLGTMHTVDRKESIFTLAAKYNLKPSTILFLNRAKQEDIALHKGELLFIPLGVIATAASREMAADPNVKNLLDNKFQLTWPLHGRLTSRFGWRTDPFLECERFHSGIDVACHMGTLVRSAERGRVVYSGWRGAAGIAVIIEHPNGMYSIYAHCSKLLVRRGQWVTRRQPIARVGSTGRSTGAHLHFALKREGKMIDPLRILGLTTL